MRCPSNAQIRRNAKAWFEDHVDDYWDARSYEFDQQFKEFIRDYKRERISEEDLQTFIDDFNFPDQDEWLSNEYESFISDIADQCYDSFRDEQMFKDE